MHPRDAEKELSGTVSSDKNEILFSRFAVNYNNEPEIFRKGSVLYRDVSRDLDPSPNTTTDCSVLSRLIGTVAFDADDSKPAVASGVASAPKTSNSTPNVGTAGTNTAQCVARILAIWSLGSDCIERSNLPLHVENTLSSAITTVNVYPALSGSRGGQVLAPLPAGLGSATADCEWNNHETRPPDAHTSATSTAHSSTKYATAAMPEPT